MLRTIQKYRGLVIVLTTTLMALSLRPFPVKADSDVSVLPATVQWMGNIQSRRLDESSGLASSHNDAGVLWSINDSGSSPEIFAMTTQGQHLGSWLIDMSDPLDWEAMASFRWRNRNYLLMADIGDNFAARSSVSFTVVAEPRLDQILPDQRLKPLLVQHFTFPDGPRDAEAVAVDIQRQELLVLSKRTVPPELYRVPLDMESVESPETVKTEGAVGVLQAQLLTALTDFSKPPKRQADLYGSYWPYIGMPTGMTLSADRLLVTTLEHAYLFDRKDLSQPAKLIKLPFAGQREAIAFAKDSSDTAYLTHEREDGLRKTAVYRIQLEYQD